MRRTINIKNSSIDRDVSDKLGMRRTINTKNSSFDQGCVG